MVIRLVALNKSGGGIDRVGQAEETAQILKLRELAESERQPRMAGGSRRQGKEGRGGGHGTGTMRIVSCGYKEFSFDSENHGKWLLGTFPIFLKLLCDNILPSPLPFPFPLRIYSFLCLNRNFHILQR